MTASPHPVIAPFEDHDDQEIIAYHKEHVPLTIASVDDVRNTDLSGQFAGIKITELKASFDLDTEDLQADDGLNVIHDAAGNHFVRASEDIIPSQRVVSDAGDVTVAADDFDIIVIKKTVGAATGVQLPSAADRAKSVRIVDGKYDAASNNITISPDGSETIMGGSEYVIDSNGGSIELTPLADGSGWI